MNNKVMILKGKSDIFPDYLYSNIYYYYIDTANNKILNFLFRFFKKFNLQLIKLFFGNWKNDIKKYSTFILFDSGCSNYIINRIKKYNKNAKIIFWYWNGLEEYNNILFDSKYIDEFWTYNRFDADKYHLKFNPQFYFKENKINKKSNITEDIIFLGRNKDRKNELLSLKDCLEKNKLKCNFHIVENMKDFLSYHDYLKMIEKSKCILDFNYYLPGGLTLRPLEAMFFEKKLITNNKDIVNYSFYDKDNIFIIGEDDINNIYEFINKPYKKINDEIKNYYTFNEWLNRILNNIKTK